MKQISYHTMALAAALLLLLTSCTVTPGTTDPGTVTPEGQISGTQTSVSGDYGFLGAHADLATYYVKIVGEEQGEITGDCKRSGDIKGTVIAYGFSAGAEQTYNAESGANEVMQHPASFFHRLDCAMPKLQRAFSTGEKLDITVMKDAVASSGDEVRHFTAAFTGATVIATEIVRDSTDGIYEKVMFTFAEVTYTENRSGNTWHSTWGSTADVYTASAAAEETTVSYASSEKTHTYLTVTREDGSVIAGEPEFTADERRGEMQQPVGSMLLYDYRIGDVASFVHRVDCATPRLQEAATNGEKLTLHLCRTMVDVSGYEIVRTTADYEDAVIIAGEIFTDGASGNLLERLTVTYRTVTYCEVITGAKWTAEGKSDGTLPKRSTVRYPGAEKEKAYTMYLSVTGEQQGVIPGDYRGSGIYENTIRTYSYSATVNAVFNSVSKTFSAPWARFAAVVHKVDCATPRLQQAAANGEKLTFSLSRRRESGTDKDLPCFSVTYEDAVICGIEIFTDPGTGALLERITFSFDAVTYTDPASGFSFQGKVLPYPIVQYKIEVPWEIKQ